MEPAGWWLAPGRRLWPDRWRVPGQPKAAPQGEGRTSEFSVLCGGPAIRRLVPFYHGLWPIDVYSPYKPGESRALVPLGLGFSQIQQATFGRTRQPVFCEDEWCRQRDRRGRFARQRGQDHFRRGAQIDHDDLVADTIHLHKRLVGE